MAQAFRHRRRINGERINLRMELKQVEKEKAELTLLHVRRDVVSFG